MSLDIQQIQIRAVEALSATWHKYWGPDGIALLLLFGTIVVAAGVTFFQQAEAARSVRGFIRYAIPVSVLRHPSARADALFWLCRHFTAPLLIFPVAITAATTGLAVNAALIHLAGWSPHPTTGVSPGLVVLFTITMLIAYDLSYYIYHVLQHNIPFMWELHKVHHSAEVMVGITATRVHPLDQVMNKVWDGLIPGVAYGVWMLFALDPVEALVFGMNVYILRNILMMDVVRHTHYPFSFGRVLDRVMLSPHAHQLHHSKARRHYNKNYGLLLSVWDRMFGTMIDPKAGETFEFGLGGRQAREYQSLFGLYILPLVKITRMSRIRLHQLAIVRAWWRKPTVPEPRHE